MTGPVRTTQALLVGCYVVGTRLSSELEDVVRNRRLSAHLRDVRSLLHETVGVLSDLVSERDARSPHGAHPDPVGDIAFIACAQLRRKMDQLLELSDASPEETLADAAASGCRHVIKATSAVEPVLAETYGLPPRLSARAFLERSLAVRRAYSCFRLQLQESSHHGREGVARARTVIRELLHSPVFPDVRFSDRADLRVLDQRLERWLASKGESEQSIGLLSDACAFAEMLAGIGQREELLEHDLRILPQVITEVRGLIAARRPLLRGHLERARGIDDGVERLLAPGLSLEPQAVLAELERALAERGRAAGLGNDPQPQAENSASEARSEPQASEGGRPGSSRPGTANSSMKEER